LDYLAALRQCVAAGAKVIIVDSFSHEHASEGGYLMTQATELDRMAGDDYAKRERVKMAAWIKPAQLRTQMINGILQMNVNLICCFRAKEKTRPIKTPGGKTEIKEMGFMAISGDELLYEMTVNCLLLPAANGVPTWKSEEPGERALMKLPQQFREIFAPQTPLSEDIGEQLARWAAGGVQPPKPEPATAGTGSQPFTVDDHPLPTESQLEAEARAAARLGKEALQAYWKTLTQPQRRMIKPLMDGELKATAIEADAMRETVPAKDEVV
jgi:hypothetical protein